MTNKPPLYRLPDFGQTLRERIVQSSLVYLAALALLAGLLTQRFAHALDYHPHLAPVLVPQEGLEAPFLIATAVLTGIAALAVLALPRIRRMSLPLAFLTYLLGSLALGPLYPPSNLLLWAFRYRKIHEYDPTLHLPARGLAGIAVIGLGLLVVYWTRQASRFRERPDVHGSARWAADADVRRSGLLDGEGGLLLGLWGEGKARRYLRHDGPEHALVFAPTRSGKGVGLVVPNLLTWPGSVLVHDIKGENWALTAGWRHDELKSLCYRFDPTAPPGKGAPYNPLLEIRKGDYEVRDAQTVADILVDPNGDKLRDHWDRTSHAFLTGLVLHVLYKAQKPTLTACAEFLTEPRRDIKAALDRMMKTKHDPTGAREWVEPGSGKRTKTHPVVSSAARALLDKSDNERSGVLSTALSFLELYRDPVVARNTATSAFRLADLMRGDHPVSLYLTVPASDLSRTRPLVRMILNQACRRLTEKLEFEQGRPKPKYDFPLLMMLDEFPALGRLRFFAESLAYLAGYGIRAFLIAQDLSQLYGLYGRDESITGNCHVRIAFAPNKPETAELLSKMAGVMTVHEERRTYRRHPFDLGQSGHSVTANHSRRSLLTADEAMRLPEDDLLIFVAGHPAIRASKIRYFTDQQLLARASMDPPAKAQ